MTTIMQMTIAKHIKTENIISIKYPLKIFLKGLHDS